MESGGNQEDVATDFLEIRLDQFWRILMCQDALHRCGVDGLIKRDCVLDLGPVEPLRQVPAGVSNLVVDGSSTAVIPMSNQTPPSGTAASIHRLGFHRGSQ